MSIQFNEKMSGFVLIGQEKKQFSFQVQARGSSFWGAWGRDVLELAGTANIEGLAQNAELLPASSLKINLPFKNTLVYSIAFRDKEGHLLRFFGEKQIVYVLFPLTIRRLNGTLFQDGVPIGEAVLFFDFLTLPGFLRSWRVRLGN